MCSCVAERLETYATRPTNAQTPTTPFIVLFHRHQAAHPLTCTSNKMPSFSHQPDTRREGGGKQIFYKIPLISGRDDITSETIC